MRSLIILPLVALASAIHHHQPRQFTNPVQPTFLSDDPSTTRRVITGFPTVSPPDQPETPVTSEESTATTSVESAATTATPTTLVTSTDGDGSLITLTGTNTVPPSETGASDTGDADGGSGVGPTALVNGFVVAVGLALAI